MKKIIYFILMSTIYSFNLNSLSQISRRNILESISKLSFLPYSINNINKEKSTNKYNILDYYSDEDSNQKDEVLINSFYNNIYFYSPITKVSCFELEKKIIELNNQNILFKNKYDIDNGPINLHIQSNGGSLFHSLYIIDLIQNIETPVYTYVDGFAASAATLISVVGKKRFITKNSLMLIHQLSSGSSGKYDELQDENQNLESFMSFIIKTYLENTKMEESELKEILRRDIWLNSSYCLQKGLVDEIL